MSKEKELGNRTAKRRIVIDSNLAIEGVPPSHEKNEGGPREYLGGEFVRETRPKGHRE